ncbi:SH2 domain-containing protein 7 [Erinaceus europaeus]|uniref:SH2 domain-containing protein 7 n=1 Tax=Erinaceus europaeus TaxID=9365 RepID=A0ABM3WGA3_ERIEU|nr:SH2 domain-containing protein 7 [Erinaceus europaeus]
MQGLEPPSSGGPGAPGGSQALAQLQELALHWFTETQAPLILQSGTLPSWFHGFITRNQTERLLRDRALGCFLIRLSDRAAGYILSYRGSNRCRHFVISQLPNRRYLVSGDTRSHGSLAELVRHYQAARLQPFGETLASACPRLEDSDLYDAIALGLPPAGPAAATPPRRVADPAAGPPDSSEPRASFPHTGARGSRQHGEEGPDRVPSLPERSVSLLDASFGRPCDVIYADLRKMNRLRRDPKGSVLPQAPRNSDSQDGPRPSPTGLSPDVAPSSRGLLSSVPPGRSPDATAPSQGFLSPGPGAAGWSQRSLKLSQEPPPGPADTYQLIGASCLPLEPRPTADTYEHIPLGRRGRNQPPHPGASPTHSKLSGPLHSDYENISGGPLLPEPGNTYEQIPAARSTEPRWPQKQNPHPMGAGGRLPPGLGSSIALTPWV